MLRRFTGVDIADFGCAFNAYRRDASSPMLGAIGKQKFTKALILSGGASVVEVDVGHTARAGSSRYSPLRLTRLALHVLAGFWPQPIQWIGVALGVVCSLAAPALGVYGVVVLDRPARTSPGRSSAGSRIVFVLGVQGFILALVGEYLGRIQRDVEGRPLYTIDEGALVSEARSGHRRRRVHLVELHPAPAGEHRSRGRLARRAHLRGEPGEPRRRDGHERLSFVHGDIRDADARARAGRGRRRDRQRRRRVARREVDQRGRLGVRDDERGGDADPARRDPRTPVERFILISSCEVYGTAERAPMDEEHPLNPRSPYAATKAGADRLAYSYSSRTGCRS